MVAERDAAVPAQRSRILTRHPTNPPSLLPHIGAEVSSPGEGSQEVLLSGQRVLQVHPGFDAATLKRLLAGLELQS
jgi:hypothetical protein